MASDFLPSFLNGEDPSASTHSFIVKVWLEEVSEDGKPVWRGHITHVPSNQKEYFAALENIPALMSSYLQIDDQPVGKPQKAGLLQWFKYLTPHISQRSGRNAPKE